MNQVGDRRGTNLNPTLVKLHDQFLHIIRRKRVPASIRQIIVNTESKFAVNMD